MKSVIAPLLFFACAGCVSTGEPEDLKKLEEILRTAGETPPGEQLEELAEQASGYVTRSPKAFLSAQADQSHCFGVDFLGSKYVDKPAKRTQELAARRAALASVTDPKLAAVKSRCLAELSGS